MGTIPIKERTSCAVGRYSTVNGNRMPSPWQSGLAKLDDSLQPFQSQLDRLQAGLEVSDADLLHSLEVAQGRAAAVRDLILAENPDSTWSDRQSLEAVIQKLEAADRERVNQNRRNKLLDLAKEFEAGTVKHRVEARTTALNALRMDAVNELRTAAKAPEQEQELPGPEAGEWLQWATSLEEEKDASTVTYLRHNYPVLERFAGEVDERYWKPALRPESQVAKRSPELIQKPAPADTAPKPSTIVPAYTQGATSGPAISESPVNSTVNMLKVPSRKRSRKDAETATIEPAVVEAATAEPAEGEPARVEPETPETSDDVSSDSMPSFGVLTQTKRPATMWVATAGVIVLCAVFAGIYHSSAKASNSPGGATASKPDIPAPAITQPAAKDAVEGTQRQTALNLERCQRLTSGNVECWGYVSNVGTGSSRISLQSVDVVDGKGNTFNLRGQGQLVFTTGASSSISAGDRAKYTVTVPDKDPDAKTLTLYVDVANPHPLEYTFRDIPIT